MPALRLDCVDICSVCCNSHHIYEHRATPRPLNIQNCRGEAKPYQIRQFLRDVEQFQLTLKD